MVRRLAEVLSYAIPVLVAVILASVVGIGVFTNRALLSIEEQLPATVLAQEHDIALVVQDLADLIRAVERARLTTHPQRFDEIFTHLDGMVERLRRVRSTYNFDNLVNASSMHAIVSPALGDIERWIHGGIPGFSARSEEVLLLVQIRAEEAYAKVREQYLRSNAMARDLLTEHAGRLNDFRRDVRRLLFGAGGLAGLIVLLAVRQRVAERNRRNAEAARRDTEARFRALVEHAPFAINVKGADGRYILMNREFAELAGTSEAEGVGKTVFDLATPQRAKRINGYDRWVMETRSPVEYEMKGAGPGEGRSFVCVKFPFLDGAGAATAIGSMWIDVTRLKAAEEKSRLLQGELAHISRLSTMGELAAGFAHELNQPLTAISNYAAGINRRLGAAGTDPRTIAVVMERICEQAQLASDIIRRLRRFIRKEDAERKPTDMNDVIRAAVHLLRADAAKQGVDLRLDLAEGLPMALVDEVGIQQVVVNLVRNGVDAVVEECRGPREVTVRTALAGDGGIRVMVEDTGRGMEAAVRERLFEPFFTTKKEGLGVGLLICRSIIEDHNGKLAVSSEAGQGTTVEFSLRPDGRD